LKKLDDKIHKEKIYIIKNSNKEYSLNKVSNQMLIAILIRMQNEQKKVAGDGLVDSNVVLKDAGDGNFTITLEQSNARSQPVFI
jgi:hypothetical protein